MIRYYVHRNGATAAVDALDATWLVSGSGVYVWADVTEPSVEDGVLLHGVFGIH